MVPTLRQHNRRPLCFESLQHIVEDQVVARLILGDGRVNRRHGRAIRGSQRRRQLKLRRPMFGAMVDPPRGGLRPRIYAMSNGATLHEDDRKVPIFASHGRGQPEDIARLCPTGDKLKARCRKVVTLVDDKMTIVRHQIRYFTLTHEALDQRDIDNAGRLPASATDDADVLRIDIEKCPQPLHPLGEQLATMDKNERIAPSSRDERGSHNRLAEGRRRSEHAMVMRPEGVQCPDLWAA
jgi:hypothetical protein